MKKLYFLIAIAGLMLTGCSQYSLVNSEVYNDANLASFRTFRIVTPADGNLPGDMTTVTYYNIAAAIREQMVIRGYIEDSNSPILVNIGLTVKKEISTEPLSMALPPAPPIGGPGPWYGPVPGLAPVFMYPRPYYWSGYYSNARVITGIYREGVLTMDIVNMSEKIPLYSSSVATILQNGDSQFRNLTGIAQAVDVLFSKYPVKVLPQYK